MRFLSELVSYIGYRNVDDFMASIFNLRPSIFLIGFAGSISLFCSLIETYVGLDPVAYLVIMGMFVADFITGTAASIKNKTFSSFKVPRAMGKMTVYTGAFTLVHMLSTTVTPVDFWIFEFNYLSFIHYFIVNTVILSLLVSLAENVEKLGFNEIKTITSFIKSIQRAFSRKTKQFINEDTDTKKDDQGENGDSGSTLP